MRRSLLLLLPLLLTACTRIEPGYVGIKVNYAGTYRGVEDVPVVTGWVWYWPPSQTVFKYPTFIQSVVWDLGESKDSPGNEEMTFNSKEGMTLRADVSLSYNIPSEVAPKFWIKYRSDDLHSFTHGYMKALARDKFNEVASRYGIEEIYGPEKEKFLTEVRSKINEALSQEGILLGQQFGFIGAPRLPKEFMDALNQKVQAVQTAQRVENELRASEAEARKTVVNAKAAADAAAASADGKKRAAILEAEGERDAALARADGIAKANRVLANSLSPGVVEWEKLQIKRAWIATWGGGVPQVEGGGNVPGIFMRMDEPGPVRKAQR